MGVKIELRVADVERSLDFYRDLGLEVTGSDEVDGWLLRAELGGVLVLTLASEPLHLHDSPVLVRVEVETLPRPGEDGELVLTDPDGYPVAVRER